MSGQLKTTQPAPRPSNRPWYSLHLSTWILLVLLTVVLGMLIAPGQPQEYGATASVGYAIHYSQKYPPFHFGIWYHGWPWQYLKRETNPSDSELGDPAWLNARAWCGSDEFREWNFRALASDIAVAVAILL